MELQRAQVEAAAQPAFCFYEATIIILHTAYFPLICCAYIRQLACCWSSRFHGSAAIMPAESAALISKIALSFLSRLAYQTRMLNKEKMVEIRLWEFRW
jgi:hypothetical protein